MPMGSAGTTDPGAHDVWCQWKWKLGDGDADSDQVVSVGILSGACPGSEPISGLGFPASPSILWDAHYLSYKSLL